MALSTTNWNQVAVEVLPASSAWKDHAFSFISEEAVTLRLQVFAGAPAEYARPSKARAI